MLFLLQASFCTDTHVLECAFVCSSGVNVQAYIFEYQGRLILSNLMFF